MADDRFRRFRHLERPRQPGAPEGPSSGTSTNGRFGALEERREEGDRPAVAGGHLDRFRPAAERPLELAPSGPEGALPFVRCAACHMDHHRAATTCTHCGADLGTAEQRAFNERLAAERRAQGAVEAAQLADLQRAQREAEDEAAKAKRAMAETLAREAGNAERRRLDAGGLGDFGAPPRGEWGGGWGGGWGGRWGGGWGWGRGRGWGYGLGLLGWFLAALLRVLFRRRGPY